MSRTCSLIPIVGNKFVTEIIFAVIKEKNAEHNNAVNQREIKKSNNDTKILRGNPPK